MLMGNTHFKVDGVLPWGCKRSAARAMAGTIRHAKGERTDLTIIPVQGTQPVDVVQVPAARDRSQGPWRTSNIDILKHMGTFIPLSSFTTYELFTYNSLGHGISVNSNIKLSY